MSGEIELGPYKDAINRVMDNLRQHEDVEPMELPDVLKMADFGLFRSVDFIIIGFKVVEMRLVRVK